MTWRHRFFDLGLFVCALGLGGYLGATAGVPTTGEIEARKNNLLPSFQEESVENIHLSVSGTTSETVLRRDRGGDVDNYFLGKSGTETADPAQVAELLRVLSLTTFLRSWDEEKSPQNDFGFSSPRVELRVAAGPRSFRVLIGRDAEVPKSAVYVQVSGTNVKTQSGVVSETFLDALSKSSQEFRGGLLFPYSKSRTSHLSIEGTEDTTHLVADGLGFVVEEGKRRVRADRTTSDLIFFHLARTKVEAFLGSGVVEGALDAPDVKVFRVTMESPDGPKVDVSLGGQCPDEPTLILALRREPDEIAGCVPRGILAALQLPEARLSSQSALPLRDDEVDHVVLEREGHRIDLIRDGAEFYLNAKERTLVPSAAAEDFLAAFTSGSFDLIPEPAEDLQVLGSITFKGQSSATFDPQKPTSEQVEAVRQLSVDLFGNSKGDSEWLRRRDDGAWLKVPQALSWALSGDDSWARNRALSDWQPTQLSKIEIRIGGAETRLLRRGESFFLEEDSVELRADPSLSRQLIDELCHLEARRYLIPPRSRPKTGLLEVSFQVRRKDGAPPHPETLYIGQRTRGGYLAWATFAEGNFVLPEESRFVIETPLRDRSPVVLEPRTLQKLSLSFDGRSYGFQQKNGSLIPKSGEASFDMVEPLVEALSGLQIVSALARQGNEASAQTHATVSLRGEGLNQEGEREDFAIHFGKELSVQGRPVVTVWRDGVPGIFLATLASFQELIELL